MSPTMQRDEAMHRKMPQRLELFDGPPVASSRPQSHQGLMSTPNAKEKLPSRFPSRQQMKRVSKPLKLTRNFQSQQAELPSRTASEPEKHARTALASPQERVDKKRLPRPAGTAQSCNPLLGHAGTTRKQRSGKRWSLLPLETPLELQDSLAGRSSDEAPEGNPWNDDRTIRKRDSYGSISTPDLPGKFQDSYIHPWGSAGTKLRSAAPQMLPVQPERSLDPMAQRPHVAKIESALDLSLASCFTAGSDVDTTDESEEESEDHTSDGTEDRTSHSDSVVSSESESSGSSRNGMGFFDLKAWLKKDAKIDEDGKLYFEKASGWTLAGFLRHFVYNPVNPEFNVQQLNVWAAFIGVAMGLYTAAWKFVIEQGVDHVWLTFPKALRDLGVFTDVNGVFPLYHYMWICPAVFGGILSYIFAALRHKIPDQNDWIKNVHTQGVQHHRTFLILLVLSTLAMCSGMSLGPESPLVLTGGMFGSWIALNLNQSILHARVMNLLAASAAVGGFFGFPLAGALFVLEIPHRTGLEYYEALIPAISSSVYAVLTNRILTGRYVTGYFTYPRPSLPLPSMIFPATVFFALYGVAVGYGYAHSTKKVKNALHDLFHERQSDRAGHVDDGCCSLEGERLPLTREGSGEGIFDSIRCHRKRIFSFLESFCHCVIPGEQKRAAFAGTLAGGICGVIGIFVPCTMFWGEAQLQTLIDQGKTPLPIFGHVDRPTSDMAAFGLCLIDSSDTAAAEAGFSIGCFVLVAVAKTLHVGLSLGTGIIGGHFWGPLFVGCAASHVLTDIINLLAGFVGLEKTFAASFRCIIILCTMASAHVVTFRTSLAIALILTLTISAFDEEDNSGSLTAFSAVLSLLAISTNIAFIISYSAGFYVTQDSRRDVTAVPQVLCEPGMEGRPLSTQYGVYKSLQSKVTRGSGGSSSRGSLVRICSFGELHPRQPSLMDQARTRAASSGDASHYRRDSINRAPLRHSRDNSDSSYFDEPSSST